MSVESGKTGERRSKSVEGQSMSASHSRLDSSRSTGAIGLMQAVVNKDIIAAKREIKKGADVNKLNEQGWTPLRKASRAGDMAMVSLLLENGANVTELDRIVVVTTASWGRTDVLRLLLEGKAKVDDASEWDMSPLVSAARHGHFRTVKLLIEYDAQVNQTDRQGSDPLMVAWESNWPEIVFYLVEKGANLKYQDDWMKLAASPATALKIAEGIELRQKKFFRDADLRGDSTVEMYKTDVKIPLNALCRWLELVPTAALGLIDKVLFLTPKDGPVRANLKRQDMRTEYLDINEWAPKEEPMLLDLAPKDSGNGSAVITRVLHLEGILSKEYLFALTLAKTEVFKSIGNRALLLHTWRFFARSRFYMDFYMELLSVALLFVWWWVTIADASDLVYESRQDHILIMYATWAVIFLVCLTEIWREVRLVRCYSKHGYMKRFRIRPHLVSYFRISMSLIWILIFILAALWDMDQSEHHTPLLKVGYIIMSYVIFARWMKVLSYLRGVEKIGPRVIPIIGSFRFVTPFVLVTVNLMFAFSHCAAVLGDFRGAHASGIADLWDRLFHRYNLAMLKHVDTTRMIDAYDSTHVQYLLILWFLAMTSVVTLSIGNVLIAIMDEQLDFQRAQSYSEFLEYRADICLTYFLAISTNPVMAPCDKLLRVIAPKMFASSPRSGYLWACYKVDEDQEEEDCMDDATQCRLGHIRIAAQKTMIATSKDLHKRITNMQMRLTKEMKLSQGYVHKTREDLSDKCKSFLQSELALLRANTNDGKIDLTSMGSQSVINEGDDERIDDDATNDSDSDDSD
eukprot:GEMP01005040.1.p1 GENE.GEMP01005040.1~~GEMP01005040.1.p1  ORF type:complete len:800 (+),score=138.53 GEMP01005040.1:212-2611(+)